MKKIIIIVSLVIVSMSYGFVISHAEETSTQVIESDAIKSKIDLVLSKKAGPLGCKTKDSCKIICDNPENRLVCIKFAVDNGFMNEGQAKKALKFANGGPGGCATKEECREFCKSSLENKKVCLEFAREKGNISDEEVQKEKEIIKEKKNIEVLLKENGGPGGCVDIESCKVFCSEQTNQMVCREFAIKHSLIRSETSRDEKLIPRENNEPSLDTNEALRSQQTTNKQPSISRVPIPDDATELNKREAFKREQELRLKTEEERKRKEEELRKKREEPRQTPSNRPTPTHDSSEIIKRNFQNSQTEQKRSLGGLIIDSIKNFFK